MFQNTPTLKHSTLFLLKSHHPQYLACAILCLGGFLGGTVTGWSSPALHSIEQSGHFKLSPSDISWIASIVNLGLLTSAPMAGYTIRKFGRKATLLISVAPSIIGWTALSIPTQIWMLYTGRFFTGVALGCTLISGSVYLSEIAEPEFRGSLSGVWFILSRLGILFSYAVGSVLPYDKLSAISVIISITFGISVCSLPESPRWLMSKWKVHDAIESLCWLRACDKSSPSPKILAEIEEMQEAVLRSEKSKFTISSLSFNNGMLKPLVVALILMFFKEACGGNVFSYFTVQIFKKTGSALDSHISGIVVGVAQLVPLFGTAYYVDRVGRKILLILSYCMLASSLASVALFCQFKTEIEDISTSKISSWIPLIFVVVYHAAYSGGPFVLTWTVTSEVIPSHFIGVISGFASAFGWMSAFGLTRYYEDMNSLIGMANTFWVYAALSVLGATCIQLLVPETVGKSLENIHRDQNQVNGKVEKDTTIKV